MQFSKTYFLLYKNTYLYHAYLLYRISCHLSSIFSLHIVSFYILCYNRQNYDYTFTGGLTMKIAAVIAEYNPFHNGHLYQLQQIKQELQPDCIMIVMSGNFTQRGIPAIIDKHTRCQMALENGADLVFELPVYYATGSAEYFARGAVSLLDKLGVVDFLHFGSEYGSMKPLLTCAEIFFTEPPLYKELLQNNLKQGMSFPTARSHALEGFLAKDNISSASAFNEDKLAQICSSPNNILGVEYCKELLRRGSTIKPVTLQRNGSNYNDTSLPETSTKSALHASANAIREFLSNTNRATDTTYVRSFVPESVYNHLVDNKLFHPIYMNDFSTVMLYQLTNISYTSGFSDYYDITPQLSDILLKKRKDFTNFSDFCLICKTKDITYSRINRGLTHILLNMKQDTIEALKATDDIHYARLLGFTSTGKEALSQIKKNASIPIITKLSKAQKDLDNIALTSLMADIHASDIYYSIQAQKYHLPIKNEYTQQIIQQI